MGNELVVKVVNPLSTRILYFRIYNLREHTIIHLASEPEDFKASNAVVALSVDSTSNQPLFG